MQEKSGTAIQNKKQKQKKFKILESKYSNLNILFKTHSK